MLHTLSMLPSAFLLAILSSFPTSVGVFWRLNPRPECLNYNEPHKQGLLSLHRHTVLLLPDEPSILLMDPVSAIGLLSGASQVAQSAKATASRLADLYGKFNNADLTLQALIGELTAIRSSITQLHDWASYSVPGSAEPDEYVEGLEVALSGCRATMEVLSDEVSALARGELYNGTGAGVRDRTKVSWNEDSMKGHQERLRAQVQALQLLLQACQW
ncbi:hypothetical protein BO70DRAFT_34302 [Aspergillus heteromorphus CBS 117.55]|uniref:Fungal N-terminal domain-containing protein n=1 Tax=Aspergillus heteromorphus CBS 117.55 TaxID=1448321 RepID=A0A317WA21_9EURO|nr:uncharacterized protein BO70DRAFT_34302 [Aspergillus heteromorphus CBS 117.55]PWY83039.1 hypothetical protein BO70DRAFT_34302 [Aspergillus heteromorphus CBS 117.55]